VKNILTRLELLERGQRGDPLIILTDDNNGHVKKMTVAEMFCSGNYGFVRVVGGSSLSDLDRLLDAYRHKALGGAHQ
jgi:hypothetical protein